MDRGAVRRRPAVQDGDTVDRSGDGESLQAAPAEGVTVFVLKDEVWTARKFYACDASELWCNYGPPSDAVTADDRLVLDEIGRAHV